MSLSVLITGICVVLSAILNEIFYDGMTGNFWGDGIIEMLRYWGVRRGLCVVAGEFYNNGAQYGELEKNLQLEGAIDWRTDFIPDDKVRYYFSAADLIVQPYKTATQSGVTQIAYHFERPMLVTNVGGLAEIVPNGKVGYVCAVDEDDIAKALSSFAQMDTKKRNEVFRKNIQTEKQKYAWSAMTAKIYENSK